MDVKQIKKVKSSLTTIKKPKSAKISITEKFNALGKHRWVNLESMTKNKAHCVTSLKKCATKYGDRIMAELNGEIQLYLPERYNSFSDRQLMELGNGSYSLINHGMSGKIYRLEIIKMEDLPGMESPSSPDPQASHPPNDSDDRGDEGGEEEDEVTLPNYYTSRFPESQAMW